jgi:hypothetical protein
MSAETHVTERSARRAEATAVAAVAPVVVPAASLTIGELTVSVPLKFSAGAVLTETQAKILDAAFQRQFVNNQAANQKARAEKFAKATTDEERTASAPLTADAIAAFYADYEPAVGGGVRQSTAEKLRHEAAWRALIAMIAEHNKATAAGEPAVIAKAAGMIVPVPSVPAKTKAVTEEQHKANLEAFAAVKLSQIERILAVPAYAERVQIQLDAIMAERGAKGKTVEPAANTVMAVTVDMF